MLGMDGVEIDQVQKVFVEFWASRPACLISSGSKSKGQVDAAVDWMAVSEAQPGEASVPENPGTSLGDLPHLGISEEAYRAAAGAVLAPSGHPTEAQQLAIENAYGVYGHPRGLPESVTPADPQYPGDSQILEWGRRFFQATWQHYATVLQPTLAAQEAWATSTRRQI